MLDAKHLIWLTEIAEIGSMSKAAQKLNLTQPTLSRAIQVIEDHVGGAVLERNARGVSPTHIGERLVEIGRKISENRLLAEETVDLWKEGLERQIRVGVGPMLAISFMGDFLASQIKGKTNYAIHVVSATAFRLLERLTEGELDIVLAPEQINLYQEELSQDVIFKDELAIYARKDHPLFKKTSRISTADLCNQKWISAGALSGISGSNKEVLAKLGLPNIPTIVSFTGDINMIVDVLEKTDCLSVLALRLSKHSNLMRNLRPVQVDGEFPSRNVALWTRRKERDNPIVNKFRAEIQKYLGDL